MLRARVGSYPLGAGVRLVFSKWNTRMLMPCAMQLSLLDEHRLRYPSCTDAEHVERIAAETIEVLGEEPPVDLGVVASFRDIGDIRVVPMASAGSLTPEPAGLVMRLRADDGLRRRRFTGFHEVGHTFQPGYKLVAQERCGYPAFARRPADDPEALADIAAAELLLPRAYFIADVRTSSFGVDGLVTLADGYEASIQATGYRYVRFWAEDVLMVLLEPGLRKEERGCPDATEKLRVRSAAWSGDGWPWVPRNKSTGTDGPLARALAGEMVHEPATLAELGLDDDRPLQLSARLMPYVDGDGLLRPRVVALYRPLSGSAHGARNA